MRMTVIMYHFAAACRATFRLDCHTVMPTAHFNSYSRLFVMQVAREAAEEEKEAVAAAGAKASAGDGGLDMFADNVDADMFAGTPLLPQGTAPAKKALLDNYDDAEGYYNFQVGESCLWD